MDHTPNQCRLQGYTNVVVACRHCVVQMPMLCWVWSGDFTLKLAQGTYIVFVKKKVKGDQNSMLVDIQVHFDKLALQLGLVREWNVGKKVFALTLVCLQ